MTRPATPLFLNDGGIYLPPERREIPRGWIVFGTLSVLAFISGALAALSGVRMPQL